MSLAPPMRHCAFLVEKANWKLYNALGTATLTVLTPPTGNFRLKITLSASTTHTDCAGTLSINCSAVTFSAAGSQTTSTTLSSKPTITTSGLDCWILIEAIDTNGQPIKQTTNTPIKIRWEDYTKAILTPSGIWASQRTTKAYTKSMTIDIGATIKFDKLNSLDPTNGKEWMVQDTQEIGMSLAGKTKYRVLIF
jgi:hypothetical protein